jgi:hypothetical protein
MVASAREPLRLLITKQSPAPGRLGVGGLRACRRPTHKPQLSCGPGSQVGGQRRQRQLGRKRMIEYHRDEWEDGRAAATAAGSLLLVELTLGPHVESIAA